MKKKSLHNTLLIFSLITKFTLAQSITEIPTPQKNYKIKPATIRNKIIQVYILEPKNLIGEDPDIVYYCKGNLWFCGHQDDLSPWFWYDGEGQPRQFDFTYTPTPMKIGKWHGYYTHVLCQWSGPNGELVNYGGECYIQTLSNGIKTIGFWLSLGEAKEKWRLNNKKIKYFNEFYFNKNSTTQ